MVGKACDFTLKLHILFVYIVNDTLNGWVGSCSIIGAIFREARSSSLEAPVAAVITCLPACYAATSFISYSYSCSSRLPEAVCLPSMAGELTDWKMFVCRQMKIHQNQMSNINVTADKGETTIAAALTTTTAAIKPDNNVMMHQQPLQQMLQHNKVSIYT